MLLLLLNKMTTNINSFRNGNRALDFNKKGSIIDLKNLHTMQTRVKSHDEQKRKTQDVITQLVSMQRQMINDKKVNKNNYWSDDSETSEEKEEEEGHAKGKRGVVCLPRVGNNEGSVFMQPSFDNISEETHSSFEKEDKSMTKTELSKSIIQENKKKFKVHTSNINGTNKKMHKKTPNVFNLGASKNNILRQKTKVRKIMQNIKREVRSVSPFGMNKTPEYKTNKRQFESGSKKQRQIEKLNNYSNAENSDFDTRNITPPNIFQKSSRKYDFTIKDNTPRQNRTFQYED